MMTAYRIAATLLLPTLLCATNPPVKLGDTLETTLTLLGQPIGSIDLRDKILLLYPEGEITLRDNKISQIDLMSEAEFEADQTRLKAEREAWLIEQEKLAKARDQEGKKLKAFKLQSSTFAALPAKERIDYWRNFQIRFPNIEVAPEIARALESYQVELAELKSQQKIAELEALVAQAEREAANARLETQKLRKEADAVNRSVIRLRNDYTTPYNYYYRPPTVIIYPGKNQAIQQINNNGNHLKLEKYSLPSQRSATTIQHISNSQ